MKEVMAMIRINMINKTKKALIDAGVSSMTAMEALGRGKGLVDLTLLKGAEPIHVDGGVVAEHVLATAVLRDESEPLRVVEPLHGTSCHVLSALFLSVNATAPCRARLPPSGAERR